MDTKAKYIALFLLIIAWVCPVQAEVILQFFNASWNEITDKIPEIAEVGYTSLWLPPPQKASGDLSVGYDLWDPFDLGNNPQRTGGRTRYGTEDELLRLMETAHRFGIRVYFDNIMNHRAFDIPGYDENTPIDVYPGMLPEDFHLQVTEEGFYRAWPDTVNWGSVWEVQNYYLSGLIDIAHESPNGNFGSNPGDTHPKIEFVRHPDNPEFYDYHPTEGLVGFNSSQITTNVIAANPDFYKEDVGGYLMRSVRWMMDRTKADGLRLDAVKHVPAYFFGEQWAAGKDTNSAGYCGQAQVQFNRSRGFSDDNHRDTLFDTEKPRDDAMIFGEHMGDPPPYTDYFAAGMRLVDAKIHSTLNNKLGNPSAGLQGLENSGYVENFQFGDGLGVAYAKSHDDAVAYHEELHYAINLTRAGLPNIYTDGNRQAETLGDSGGAFPRHANTKYLGQEGDDRIPNLVYIHNQFARGSQYGRDTDADVLAYERIDKRENEAMTDGDGVVLAMLINDNYSGYEYREITTSFPEGALLWQYSSAGGHFYHTVTNGKIKVATPPGGYYAFSWRNPEEADAWKNLGGHPISLYEDGQETGWVSYEREDGPDGDPGFNPYGVTDENTEDFKYTWYVPRVTSATNLQFDVHVDGSAYDVKMKLDGGINLNTNNHALGDSRDNPPALSTDVYLGYEDANFVRRIHAEKFAAVDTARNIIGSVGSESYEVTIGQAGTTVNQSSGSNDYDNTETASFIYHDPDGSDDLGNQQFYPSPTNASDQQVWLEVKTGNQYDINKVFVYYTTNGTSWPEGSGGDGYGGTKVHELYWHHSVTNGAETNDWWGSNPLPAMAADTVLRYKVGCFREQNGSTAAPWVVRFPNSEESVNLKKSMTGKWNIDPINPSTITYRPHIDYGITSTGLVEGFHVIAARAFLQRDGAAEGNGKRSAIYNTWTQPFYLDTHSPEGEVVWPQENDTISLNSYGAVVRTDPTVTAVWYYIDDANPANDDGQTGNEHGNGTNALGEIAWTPATRVNKNLNIVSDYPAEWRFDYNNVASSNSAATIYVKLAEVSSSTNPLLTDVNGHFTTLARNVIANGPNYSMIIAWPQRDGEVVGENYDMKVHFSEALWDVDEDTTRSRFLITIDDEVQGRDDYQLNWYGAGANHELLFQLPDLYNGDPEYQHLIEVVHTNAASGGVSLFASRIVKAWPSTPRANIKIIDPPMYDLDGAIYYIVLPDVAVPTPEQRQYTIRVETDMSVNDVWIEFTNSVGYADPIPAATNALSGTVSITNGQTGLVGSGTQFDSEVTVGSVLRINSNLVAVSSIESATNLTLNDAWAYSAVSGESLELVTGNPEVIGANQYWSYLWTNMAPGAYTILAHADTNNNPATIEATAERQTSVILREGCTNNPADYDDDDDGLYDDMENYPTNLPASNAETWNNGDVHIWMIYGKTDSLRPDSDGDGLSDGLESGWRVPIDSSQTDTNMDTNGDGWNNFRADYDPPFFNTVPDNWDVPDYNFNGSRTEMIAGSMTDPNNPDTDYDGIPDGIEDWNRNGWVDGDGAALGPTEAKGDRTAWPDGEIQNWETWTETDPNNWDTDGDGASDGYSEDADFDGWIEGDVNSNRIWEAGEEWGETDPLNSDTDGDGLPDGWEMQYSFSPYDDGVIGHTNMGSGDIITNVLNGANGNPDGDVIVQGDVTNAYVNLLEFQNGTNPWVPDDSDEPPPGSITIGPGPVLGIVNGVTNYDQRRYQLRRIHRLELGRLYRFGRI